MGMKKAKEEAIETLQHLGLTFSQSRIYLSLVNSGEATAKIISKMSGVARAEVYRTIPTLQKLGLAEKVLTIPIKFKATPPKEGLAFLLKQKNMKHTELQEKTTKLIDEFTESKETKLIEEGTEFVIIPEGKMHRRWIVKRRSKTQKSVDVFVTPGALRYEIHNDFEQFQELLEKGVKIRYLVFSSSEIKNEVKINPYLIKNPDFQIRSIANVPLVATVVFDNKEGVLSNPTNNLLMGPKLWSNNPHFIALVQNYFETVWKTAKEYKNRKTKALVD
ncbi:MAG: hypothetical protein CW691_04155 [Candidatus Bathyarchaeum sp.]|nr:MAG: hypothetical protein CW691_04155 [Candidatus Bathyarchaeum sp.]